MSNVERRVAGTERILDQAARLFIRQGYDATSIEQIASEAGYTKGAVYFYFNSKQGLLMRLLDRIEELAVKPTLAAVDAAQGGALHRLVAFLHAQSIVGEVCADYMLLAILMNIELHGSGEPAEIRLKSLMDRLSRSVANVVSEGQKEGVFRKDVPADELASVIMALDVGCFVEWARRRDNLSGTEFVRTMRRLVLTGLVVTT